MYNFTEMLLKEGNKQKMREMYQELGEVSICNIIRHFFELDFDSFWEEEKKHYTTRSPCEGGLLVFEGIKEDMECAVKVFKSTFGHEPTLNEFIEFFPRLITSDIFEYHIKIRPYGFTMDDVINGIKEIIKPALKGSKSPQSMWHQYSGPTTPVDVEQLWLYLRTYDLFREGLPVDEVVKKIFPETDKETAEDYDSKIRAVYKFQEKAKRIIKNVEGGLFPGKYKSDPSGTPWDSLRVS